jgi:sialate O-acetylesterase
MSRLRSVLAAIVAFAVVGRSMAGVRLPRIFADHMILQSGQPVPIWGWAESGERISVEFAGQQKSAVADPNGNWSVKLDALAASAMPRELTVRATNTVKFSDVLVGEVWLASGQSNMAFSLSAAHNAAEALAAATDPLLRFFTVQHATAAEPQTDLRGNWELSTPATAKNFSAAAYFFARELRAKLDCPVAILHSSWGGTPAQTWLSLDALRQDPPFTVYLKKWDEALAQHHTVLADPARSLAYQRDLKQWQKDVAPVFNAAMKDYNAANSAGPKPVPARPEPTNPDPIGMPSPSARPSIPSVIYNAQIAPLATYAIRGALWYQGEANGAAGLEYRALLPRLIADWRTRWAQGDFPFLIVQLPGWNHDARPAEFHDWPWLREAQSLTARDVSHAALAVTIDLGNPNDVHPKDKLDVGHRLALLARRLVYGESIVASGPMFRGVTFDGPSAHITFDEVGAGLAIGEAPWRADGVDPLPTDRLLGFALAGADRVWHDADVRIEGDGVIVSSSAVATPIAVRYAWANSPHCNLYNRDGLPAAPFRSDDWPLPTPPKKN